MKTFFLLLITSCFGFVMPLAEPDINVLLEQNNTIRREYRPWLPPLQLDQTLTNAAQDQASYMARYPATLNGDMWNNPVYSHDSNGGFMSRVRKHKCIGNKHEEILNMRPPGWGNDVWLSWMKSSSHRESVLSDCKYVGYGFASNPDGSSYWCAVYSK